MQLSKEFSFVETVKGKVNTKGFKNFLSASSIVIKMETEDLTLKLLHLDYKEENYFYVGNYFLNI